MGFNRCLAATLFLAVLLTFSRASSAETAPGSDLRNAKGGPKALQQESSKLPTRASGQTELDELVAEMRENLLPDGPVGESAGYQSLIHSSYFSVVTDARKRGLRVPRDVYKKIERAFQFHMYTIQPDGNSPPFGDALAENIRPMLGKAAYEYSRRDMAWVATEGKQGEQPRETSIGFPYSKYYVMRSNWRPEELYLCLKNGSYASHGHRDSLGFVMYAHGNPIFVDPGAFTPGSPDEQRLAATKSHCSITVDDKNLLNGGGPNEFFAGEGIDYLYAQGPGYEGLPESIYTVRRIIFLKPDYWVFSDVIRGEGEHQVDSYFHFASTKAELDADSRIARTTYPRTGNVALIPVDPKRTESKLEPGETALVRDRLSPALVLRQSAKTELPFRIDNVAYPFKGLYPIPRLTEDARVTSLNPPESADVETTGIRVESKKGVDYIILTGGACHRAEFAESGIHTTAQAAVIRRERGLLGLGKDGRVKGFSWIWGTELGDRNLLATSDHPVPALDVIYDGDEVRVTTTTEEPSLKIAALEAKTVVINGGDPHMIRVEQGFFQPFEDQPQDYTLVDDETDGFAVEKPATADSAGRGSQVGFTFHWARVSPKANGLLSYTPYLAEPGEYEVLAFIPRFRLIDVTREAHYTVKFTPGGRWIPPDDKRVVSIDSSNVGSGWVDLRVNQKEAAGSWVSLGRCDVNKPDDARVEVHMDSETGGAAVLADAVKWSR